MKVLVSILCLVAFNAYAADTKIPMAPATKVAATQEMNEGFALIHVAELDKWMATEKGTLHIYDANNDKTREKNGIIPGATTLKSANEFSVATLPKNKDDKVVFYCANQQCMASHDAAKVAVRSGYNHVYVMADGIEGWKKAGKQTRTYNLKM